MFVLVAYSASAWARSNSACLACAVSSAVARRSNSARRRSSSASRLPQPGSAIAAARHTISIINLIAFPSLLRPPAREHLAKDVRRRRASFFVHFIPLAFEHLVRLYDSFLLTVSALTLEMARCT